ncbi:putative protein serine/threonine kinase [Rhizophlyctis rosea]|nr:putative protein serine/threonine kinase [Rhizophlyctis rosea]
MDRTPRTDISGIIKTLSASRKDTTDQSPPKPPTETFPFTNLAANAIRIAETPDRTDLRNRYPSSDISAYGLAVGLPGRLRGIFEVGHLTGAGRILHQVNSCDVLRIELATKALKVAQQTNLVNTFERAKSGDGRLHLLGLGTRRDCCCQTVDDIEDIHQEIAILSELDSKRWTRYYGSFIKGTKLWIIMELCSGGSCVDLIKAGRIAEPHVAVIMRELLPALDSPHRRGR